MDAARQVLRFSIPGSVVVLWTIMLTMFGRYCEGAPLPGVFSAVQSNVGALAAILAAIPVGFVVCQIYYIFYRETVTFSPRDPDKRWIRLDRGAQILDGLPDGTLRPIAEYFGVKDVDVDKAHEDVPTFIGKRLRGLRLSEEYRKAKGKEAAIAAYKKRWRKNWDLMRALIELSEESSGGGAMRSEYTTLSDLYHALGACRTAVQTAWLISVVLAVAYVIDGQSLWWSFVAIAGGGAVTAILWWVFHATRRLTWISAKGSLQLGLTALIRRRPELFEPADPGQLAPHGVLVPHIPEPVRDRIHHRLFLIAARLANLVRAGHTAGSLVFVFAEDDSVLLVKPTYRGGWGLPGGGLKRGEQSVDAVRRETLEETGIEIDVGRPIAVYVQRKRRHIDHLFFCRVADRQQPQPKSEKEISGADWFALDRLPPLQSEACEALLRLRGEAPVGQHDDGIKDTGSP